VILALLFPLAVQALTYREVPGAHLFGAIRYAVASRWEPPRLIAEPEQMPGALACPQRFGEPTSGKIPPQSEDCLLMTVWAPSVPAAKPLPVLVYLHGGGLVSGAGLGDGVDGVPFVSRGFLFVSFNYRLDVLGYLAEESEPGKASLGLLDQAAALRWVAANAGRFGGDAANITLLGHSMGAYSARKLVSAGLAPAGVKRVILLSQGSMFGQKQDSLLPEEKKRLLRAPTGKVFEELKGRLFSLHAPAESATAWRGVKLLQTVLAGESHKENFYLCEADGLAREVEPFTDSYVAELHGFGSEHGTEVLALFHGEARSSLDYLAKFSRPSEPPASLVFTAKAYRAANPKKTHWWRWWSYDAPLECVR